MTGLWKTDQNVTLGLGLFDFIGSANSYTHTLPRPFTMASPGLVDWSTFL